MADSAGFKVKDVKICARDITQLEVLEIYAFKDEHYAVYRTAARVAVQFSDTAEEEKTQRAALAKLNPLRSDINGLIDGWRRREACQKVQDCDCDENRTTMRPVIQYVRPSCLFDLPAWLDDCLWKRRSDRLAAKARRYDRSVADGLVLALENDFDSAVIQLQATKDDIVAERTSRARFEYLTVAFWACAFLTGVSAIAWKIFLWVCPQDAYNFIVFMLLAAAGGGVGAFFSVAIAIRARTILTDLRSRDNRADAVLRIAIGAIGAAFFVAALREKVAVLTFGTLSTTLISQLQPDWLAIIVAAFVAGFSERLVPDLLAKATVNDAANAAPTKPSKPSPAAPPTQASTPKTPGNDDGDNKDCCSVQDFVPAGQETPDTELPPARGGVAKN